MALALTVSIAAHSLGGLVLLCLRSSAPPHPQPLRVAWLRGVDDTRAGAPALRGIDATRSDAILRSVPTRQPRTEAALPRTVGRPPTTLRVTGGGEHVRGSVDSATRPEIAARAAAAAEGGADAGGAGSEEHRTDTGASIAYVESVRQRIAAQQRYPESARRRHLEGVVIALLEIGPDGSLVRYELAGDAAVLLARSTREAIMDAAPFLPPPPGTRRIRVPVKFTLHP